MRYSAVLIVPAEMKPQADALGAAMGWGPVSYTIPLGAEETVTHYAARADVPERFVRWVKGLEPLPDQAFQPVVDVLFADVRPDPTCDGDDAAPVLWGRDHLNAVLAERGMVPLPPAPPT